MNDEFITAVKLCRILRGGNLGKHWLLKQKLEIPPTREESIRARYCLER